MNAISYPEHDVRNLQNPWLQNRGILHGLYISENKRLSDVKRIMEAEHGFPVLRLHEYEVALRETLKLRKNLKSGDWYTIGVCVLKRKEQGKMTQVLWNDRPMTAQKVRKEILRNRKLSRLRHVSAELPLGIIVRTPPGSPPPEQCATVLSTRIHSDQESGVSLSCHAVPDTCEAEFSNCTIQVELHGTGQLDASCFRHLREDLPFNRFMSEILCLARTQPTFFTVLTDSDRNPGPRLFGANPSLDVIARMTYQLSNNLLVDWRSKENRWFLDWFSLSADFGLLRKFFSIKTPTACAVYQRLCKAALDLQKSALARVLFELKYTVQKNYFMVDPENALFTIAVQVGSRADGMLELAKRAFQCISPRSTSTALCHCLSRLSLVAASRRDMPMLRFLVGNLTQFGGNADVKHDGGSLLPQVMSHLYTWSPEDDADNDETILDYIHLLIQAGIISTTLPVRCCCTDRPKVQIRDPRSITVDELIMICPPIKRQYLYSVVQCINAGHCFPTIAGIFTAAANGANGILAYLHSCEEKETAGFQAIIQECLIFSANINDTVTASALLELGADPEVGLLSNNRHRYHKGMMSWNPMIVAAAAGNLEILQLFRERSDLISFIKNAPIYEIVQGWDTKPGYHNGSRRGKELRRLENLQRHYLHSYTWTANIVMAEGTMSSEELRHMKSLPSGFSPIENGWRITILTWIRNIAMSLGISQTLDKEIIGAAISIEPESRVAQCKNTAYHPCDVLLLDGVVDDNLDYREGDLDLLQLSIYAQCSLKVVEFLLSKGLYVHSRAAPQSGNTMLHDALLSHSQDRSQIVRLLVRHGANYKQCGRSFSILEASLELEEVEYYKSQRGRSPNLEIFTFLFEAGASVRLETPVQGQDRQPLVCRLVAANAEDELILRVLDAGADINGRGTNRDPRTVRMTPLEAAIYRGRARLARELIQRGADIHTPADDVGTLTALQFACYMGCSLQFVEYLIKERGADVNERPAQLSGFTALQAAASSGSLSLTELLLAQGADVNAFGGETEYLSEQIGDPWSQLSSPRWRALDSAALAGRLDIVEFLLKAGGRSGTTGLGGAIAIAKTQRHFAILSVLLEWEKEHRSMITGEEAVWQEQNPNLARIMLDTGSNSEFSVDSSSEAEDSEGTDLDE